MLTPRRLVAFMLLAQGVAACSPAPPRAAPVRAPAGRPLAEAPSDGKGSASPAGESGPLLGPGSSAPPVSPVASRRSAFASPDRVTVSELISGVAAAADALREAPAVRADYAAFLASHGLADAPALLQDYLRVRVVFEATRDGGLWGLVWDITNRPGHSDAIWRAWQTVRVPAPGTWGVTAVAECDELSALFAFLVRQLGVSHAGVLGGGPMHIVGHWTLRLPHRREVRVVIPTSQVFLSREATLGTPEINAYSAAVVWDYWRKDVPPDHTVPRALADYLLAQLELARLPAAELQQRRNAHGRS